MNHTSDGVAQPRAAVTHPLLIISVLGFSSLCSALMQSLVIPVQPDLPELLHTSVVNASWVITATLLAGAVAMPVAGRLADVFGRKPVLVASACLLLAGSLLCAVSSSFALVLLGRVLQGASMGYIPVAISMVRDVAPPHMVNPALAVVSATLGVGGALGLPLADWIVETVRWRGIFWLAAGLAVAMIVGSAAVLPHAPVGRRARFDLVGAVGLSVGLVSLLVGVSKGHDWGWSAPSTVCAILVGAVVLGWWGRPEVRRDEPLVDLRTMARRPVLLTNLAALMIGFAMMAQSIVVPQLLQLPPEAGGLGQTILQTGMWMAPSGLMMLAFSPVSSTLLTRFGGRVTLAVGAGVIASGYLIAVMGAASVWTLLAATCIASAGVGIGYAAMPELILGNVPDSEASSGVGVNSLMRSMGSTFSGAVMAMVLAGGGIQTGDRVVPAHSAFQLCFGLGVVAALVAAVVTLLIPSRDGLSALPERTTQPATV